MNYGFVQFSRVSELTRIDGTPKVLESKDEMDKRIKFLYTAKIIQTSHPF